MSIALSGQNLKAGMATLCCLVGAYLVFRWFYHFNGLSRMFFGVIGVALIGLSLLLSQFGEGSGLSLVRKFRLAAGWLLLVLGSACASFLAWFASRGGI